MDTSETALVIAVGSVVLNLITTICTNMRLSRCTKIRCCGFEIDRDLVTSTNKNDVNI